LRIAILNLTAGGLSGGYRKYLLATVPRMRQHPSVSALSVFLPAEAVRDGAFVGDPWVTLPSLLNPSGRRALRHALDAVAPDVVFIPTGRWLRCSDVPTVVMARNMEPFAHGVRGNGWSDRVKNVLRAYVAKRAWKKATRVIAVSEHVRDFLIRSCGIESAKIGLVYHGIDAASSFEQAPVPSWPGAPPCDPFVLAVGSIRPARGLEDVIEAVGLANASGFPLSLVVAGRSDRGTRGYERRMHELAGARGIADRVVWAGHLGEPQLSWCFRRCAAFVMTSRAEACPNTALEAMSHGAACVSTSAAPMPEFFADSALYYPPADAGALAGALRRVVGAPPSETRRYREAAVRRASSFSWDRTVHLTLQQLELARG